MSTCTRSSKDNALSLNRNHSTSLWVSILLDNPTTGQILDSFKELVKPFQEQEVLPLPFCNNNDSLSYEYYVSLEYT